MSIKHVFAVLCMGLLSSFAVAQKDTKEVLFTIDEVPYYTEDFNHVYNKNINLIPESERDVREYLDLYINYKLKVHQAKSLGLDTLETYKRELAQNRNQLVSRYLSTEKVTDDLVEEAYKRSLKEINASHILFLLDPHARPEDSLKMYQKAMKVREEIQAGAVFSDMAKKYSDDPSAVENGGNVGFFSVLRMVYPFETGTYRTAVGEVSLPVRSQFGYHLIKVEEVRATRGEISIAHIMLLKPEKGTIEEDKAVEKRIRELYKQLQEGADFKVLVQQYSEDNITKEKDGEIHRFASGALRNPVMENAAYALKEPDDISEPVETDYAWHILRLIKKYPLPSFEEARGSFLTRVKRDDRSRVINDYLIEELRKQFPIEENKALVKKLPTYFSKEVLSNAWKVPEKATYTNTRLVLINNSLDLQLSDFFDYVQGNQLQVRNFKEVSIAVEVLYKSFVETELKNYYTNNLENLNSEFRALMTEYEDGLLLFDLMQQEVWQKVKQDTLGYTAYYEEHKEAYYQPEKASVLRFEVGNKKDLKKVKKLLGQGKSKLEVLESFEAKDTQRWKVKEGLVETAQLLEEGIKVANKGVYTLKEGFKVIEVKEVFPAGIAPLDSIRGQVISNYQEAYEQEWMEKLRNKAVIKRNEEALKGL